MKKEILFISDLHLAWEKPEITKRFIQFLETRAIQAKALYILGDLFDAWVGDDDFTPPSNMVRAQLKQLNQSGVRVFLQHGNRDFLIGPTFCNNTGVTLLDDYAVIDLFGEPTLITHGDLLCTDDYAYQAFRVKSRADKWQHNVLNKPLFVRLLAARWYRFRSFFHKRQKTQDIMDVNQGTVINTMTRYNCLRLIHGHTHRPDIHTLSIHGNAAQRFVLADWSPTQGEALVWDENGYSIETF